MNEHLFHPERGYKQEEKLAGDVRAVIGDGTPYLKCPGLKKVESVRVGNVEIPLSEKRRFPKNLNFTDFEEVDVPLLRLYTDDDGVPTLLRAKVSNDGIWQAGETFYVRGDWEEASKPKAAARAKAEPGVGDTDEDKPNTTTGGKPK